jgi:hypothetical protein
MASADGHTPLREARVRARGNGDRPAPSRHRVLPCRRPKDGARGRLGRTRREAVRAGRAGGPCRRVGGIVVEPARLRAGAFFSRVTVAK